MRTLIGVIGTTAVGKSDVAVKLAQMLDTSVISADSMQIYRYMDIGTAKITAEQMCGVPHYMLDVVDPNEQFSSFMYQEMASKIIDEMNTTPILVGGTGFYFDSLLYPPEFGNATAERRAQLNNMLERDGLPALTEMLRKLDEPTYMQIDLSNPKRVVRAIEIAESGVKKSQGSGRFAPRYKLRLFVLQRNRDELYKQIDARVDGMINAGLVQEVRRIVDKFGICDTPAYEAIGYKEVIEYLTGNTTLENAIAKIKLNTRHYAKRQISYFKRMQVEQSIDVDNVGAEAVARQIFDICNKDI